MSRLLRAEGQKRVSGSNKNRDGNLLEAGRGRCHYHISVKQPKKSPKHLVTVGTKRMSPPEEPG